MSVWHNLGAESRKEVALPDVIGERCVHTRIEQASCRACVEACPNGAWIIDEQMLGIDSSRCDGCDLCVPACPEGAITGRFKAAVKASQGGALAFAACEHADAGKLDEGMMPCIHSLGTSELLRLYRRGVRHLIVTCGRCDLCGRGAFRSPLSRSVAEINRLLLSHKLESLSYRELGPKPWLRALQHASELAAGRGLDRRSFFRNAFELPRKQVQEVLQDHDAYTPPAMLLPEQDTPGLLPFVPVLDEESCTGCDSCVRLCPHGAIRLDDEHAEQAYLVDARRCSNCRICLDVCESGAIEIKRLVRPETNRIPLSSRRCRACGVPFHTPKVERIESDLCQICTRTNHRKLLFQVLD